MTDCLASVRVPNRSHLPKDLVVNSWVFRPAVYDLTNANAIATLLANFYNSFHDVLSNEMDWLASTVEFYNLTGHLDGTPHGSPNFIGSLPIASPGAVQSLPTQLSICLSYQRDYGSDPEAGGTGTLPTVDSAVDVGAPATHTGQMRPRSRDRGRIFLGPLSVPAIDMAPTPSFRPFVKAAVRAGIATAAHVLLDAAVAGNTPWVQWSRRGATSGLVTKGFVSDKLAIQRGRAQGHIARDVWTA
jgi:hypothetical protein